MSYADSDLIYWLFHKSKISRYKISKDIGIPESTLSRIATGETPIEAIRFKHATMLTVYAWSALSSEQSVIGSIDTTSLENTMNNPNAKGGNTE